MSVTLDHDVRESAVDGIVTPEAIVLELDLAGVAGRVLAGLLDTAVQALLFVILMIVIGLSGGFGSGSNTAVAFMIAAVVMVYPVVSEMLMRGQTIGKRAMGLKVVTVEGSPIRLRHALLRMMGGIVDRLLLPFGIVGMLFVLGTRRSQRVGDLVAGTIVVRIPDRTMMPPAVWFPVPPGHEEYAATINPTTMTVAQYTVIRNFLMRNQELSVEARFGLATKLADATARTLGHYRGTVKIHPEAYLLCAIARYQRRTFPEYQPPAWQGR